MDVSENSGTPQIIHFNRVFHYKASILGYPPFLQHPYVHYINQVYHYPLWPQTPMGFLSHLSGPFRPSRPGIDSWRNGRWTFGAFFCSCGNQPIGSMGLEYHPFRTGKNDLNHPPPGNFVQNVHLQGCTPNFDRIHGTGVFTYMFFGENWAHSKGNGWVKKNPYMDALGQRTPCRWC